MTNAPEIKTALPGPRAKAIIERDKAVVSPSYTRGYPLVIERGQGVYIYDSNGKPYIDGMAGLWCTALGHGNEELVEAAARQMRKLSFGHLFTGKSHDGAIELAERLKEIAPSETSKVFFCNSGSEANDTQVKLVWYMNNALGRPRRKSGPCWPSCCTRRRDRPPSWWWLLSGSSAHRCPTWKSWMR